MRIIDLLNKIKWDKNLNKDCFSIIYFDRVNNNEIEINYNKIKKIEGNFMVIEKDLEESNIPLHRIKKIMKDKEVIWQR
jgi:uncharacterized protein (UPF0248 family)